LITKIADETHSDAVLVVSILKVKASIHATTASWDDMTEQVASKKMRALTPWEGHGNKGWVYAATADMNLYNKTGRLLWKSRRGFAVLALQVGMGGGFHERPLTAVYNDNARMQRWLESTLGQLAPPVREITGESPQISPELQRQLEKAKHAGEEPK
jgi:hypothetical protein